MKNMAFIKWYGGKHKLVKWILEYLPKGNIYVEPYGGSCAVLLNKERSELEVYNDINGDLVNLFRAIQDENRLEKLKKKLNWTLYSFDEYKLSLKILEESSDPDERAWAFFVALNQSISGKSRLESNWSRQKTVLSSGQAWISHINKLDIIRERLKFVQIDNRDALEVIKYYDSPNTVFYLDPPYLHETRVESKAYKYEMLYNEHENLINLLKTIQGKFALSTYDNDLYKTLLEIPGIKVYYKDTLIHASVTRDKRNSKRTEALYVKE